MNRTPYSKLFNLVNHLYVKIFREDISFEIEKFLNNISYVGVGIAIASLFTFSFNILAGRCLGPSEYGTFTLVQSVAMFLYIPMLLGFHTAMVKYNAEKVDFLRQRTIISTTYILALLFTITSLLIFISFSKEIIAIFSISIEIYHYAILFAVLFVFYTLSIETLRSLHMIREYARIMPVYSATLFLAFLIFAFVLKDFSYKCPLYSMLIAYGVTGGAILVFLRNYLRPQFSKKWAHKLHRYSYYSLMGGISAVFYSNLDKIIISIYMSTSNVGTYGAYNYSFVAPILLFSSIFVTVFFPIASMCSNKKILFGRLNKVIILLMTIGWPLAFGMGYIILKLYGGGYPFDLSLALLFTTAGICISIDRMYGQLLNSVGVKGVKITSCGATILAVVNVALNILLIPHIGLYGAIIATIVAYLISISISVVKWKDLANSCEIVKEASC